MERQTSGAPKISSRFLNEAANILGDTDRGLTAMEIQRELMVFAEDWGVVLPNPSGAGMNKRTALSMNLAAFSDEQKYRVIRALCDLPGTRVANTEERNKLRLRLIAQYGAFGAGETDVTELAPMVNEANAWLAAFPEGVGGPGVGAAPAAFAWPAPEFAPGAMAEEELRRRLAGSSRRKLTGRG